MDSLEELTGSSSKKGFFKHVFSFEDDDKGEMMNIIQYALFAVIPVIILNKSMQKFVPEADDEKGSLEITAEVIFQIIFMFLSIYFINKMIIYFPTYGGVKYPDFSVTTIILAVLVIVLSLQTKLGEKISILVERLVDLWEGNSDDKKNKNKNNNKNGTVKVSQPISQNIAPQQMSMSTPISQLPSYSQQPQQQQPNYDNMYQNDNTPLVGAASPGMNEIVAANEMVGGAFANF
jgi:hypothetical protein